MYRKKISALIIAAALPFIAYFVCEDIRIARYLKDSSEIKHREIRTLEISESGRKKDFEELWKTVTEGIPSAELYRDEFGLDIAGEKEKYWSCIEKADTNIGYLCAVQSVLNDIPSVHTGFFFPNYETITDYVCLGSDIVRSDPYLKSYTECWNRELKNYYRESRSVVFRYTDGKYCYDAGASEVRLQDSECSIIDSIGGMLPENFITEYLSSSSFGYDEEYGKLYRNSLVFNDRKGEKITVSVRDSSGNITETELYYDLCDEYAYVMQPYIHGVFEKTGKNYNTGHTGDGTVYICADSFSGKNGQEISDRIRSMCSEDGMSVILDLRENGGGTVEYAAEYIYPALYSDTLEADSDEYILSSYGNRGFFGGLNGILNRRAYDMKKISSEENALLADYNSGRGYLSYGHHTLYRGTNQHSPDVYILVSDRTASAADHFVSAVSGRPDTVVIGENTGGEKNGGQYMAMLPESRLVYCYNTAVCFSESGEDNSLYGTAPDIRCRITADGMIRYNQLILEGKDPLTLKNRLEWDDVLKKAVNLINEK